MAKKVNVVLVDDIDGSDADRTVSFTYEGTEYEIDLSDKNAERFESALEPYLAKARKTSSGRGRRRAASAPRTGRSSEASEIRAWARSKGMQVPDRGRIPTEVRDAWEAAK